MSYSLIKRTRKEKLAAMAAALAITIARQRKDPAYDKHKLLKSKFVEMKKRIFARYRAPAMRLAKQNMKKSMMGSNTKRR